MFDKFRKDFRWRYAMLLLCGAMGYLFFYLYPSSSGEYLICPFKFVSGIPCPACGSTRATTLLFQGELSAAFWLNPLVFITHFLFIIGAIWMCKDILTNRETLMPTLQKRWSLWVLVPILILLSLNMWWNYLKGL